MPPHAPHPPHPPPPACRRGANLYHTQFSDAAPADFPVNASGAPFTGAYRPTQKLAFLSGGQQPVAGEGGSQGLWTLNITDLAPNPDRWRVPGCGVWSGVGVGGGVGGAWGVLGWAAVLH